MQTVQSALPFLQIWIMHRSLLSRILNFLSPVENFSFSSPLRVQPVRPPLEPRLCWRSPYEHTELQAPGRLTSQQHLVQQVVDLGQAAELNELQLFDHLPGDALQGGQQEQQLPETPPGVILAVVNIVF